MYTLDAIYVQWTQWTFIGINKVIRILDAHFVQWMYISFSRRNAHIGHSDHTKRPLYIMDTLNFHIYILDIQPTSYLRT